MGRTKKLHITISTEEADSFYRHAALLQDYLRQEADTEHFANYCQLSDETNPPAVLRKMRAVLLDADPRYSPGISTAPANVPTAGFVVNFDISAMEIFRFPFRHVLDRELLRADETNEPRQFLGEGAYEVLGQLAVKLARADLRVSRMVYEAPSPLSSRANNHCTPKMSVGSSDLNDNDAALDAYIEWVDADGWRTVHPDELGHLSAEEARNLMRADAGHPPETPAERLSAEETLIRGAHVLNMAERISAEVRG